MKTSIATVSLSGDLTEKIAAAAQAGFAGVEIFENDLLAFDGSPREIGRMVRDAGLDISVFQPFRDFEGMPDTLRTRTFDRAERKFDVMAELGTDLMLVCSNVSPQALGGIDRAAADLAELAERAGQRGLRIGYEALAWGRFVNDHRDAWEIVRRADHSAVGLILDSFHTLSRGLPVDSIRAVPKDKLFLVQLADAPALDLDLLSWSRHFRCMPGQGSLAVAAFAEAVAATGYDGFLSLEIFNDQFRAGSARQVALDGQRSLTYLADQIGAVQDALPPKARCEGVEFIEFALDETGAGQLRKVFQSLGFSERGRHRSKDVSVWAQGDIHLVVNGEREGFAHSSYITHGPSVCALCLKVDDAKSAHARALQLGASSFRQPVLQGELQIPAIRGVGGSLIYLVDGKSELGDLWTIDFERIEAPASPALLTGIDHVSQAMEYDEMLSWLLFYTSIFDLTKTPGLDIADPAGLVRSQVVRSGDGALKLILNGSQGHRTMSGRFLAEFFGSGVQHIAFTSSDIFAAADAMAKAGLATVPVPENYYDDLAARFGLSDEELAAMQRRGILYDRDENGEFLQLYTVTFADRFFFEIVERRAGYAGFGAPNAPIRLAAQARLSRPAVIPRR